MKVSVTAILVCKDELFVIERAAHLRAFPGFHSFPGGKVDRDEADLLPTGTIYANHDPKQINALFREVEEELGIDLREVDKKSGLVAIDYLACATSPDFHIKRFQNYVYRVVLKEKPVMTLDAGEIARGQWMRPEELQKLSVEGKLMAVPPIRKVIKKLAENLYFTDQYEVDLRYDKEIEVPEVEVLEGVKTLLVKSHTLPPADRTNCFVLGDQKKTVVDPSPRDEKELKKLIHTLEKYQVEKVLLTHHHGDHHQLAPELAQLLRVPIFLSQDTRDRIQKKWGRDYFGEVKTQTVKENEVVCRVLGDEVKVMFVPGHDEGQIALYKENWDWCIVGDLIQTVGTVVIGDDEGDMAKYFDSLERVIAKKPKYLFPSHGLGLGGTHRLSETLKHRKMREQQVLDLLTKNVPRHEILPSIYPDLPEGLHPYAEKTIEAHIKKLKEEGRA